MLEEPLPVDAFAAAAACCCASAVVKMLEGSGIDEGVKGVATPLEEMELVDMSFGSY
jgi:uncharacterized OsmC-like protein